MRQAARHRKYAQTSCPPSVAAAEERTSACFQTPTEMEALPAAQGPGDCKGLLEQLSQQVGGTAMRCSVPAGVLLSHRLLLAVVSLCVQVTALAARIEDLEEHVSDLSTDVRLQARKALPPLSTADSHDGSLHNSSGQHSPAILSPRGNKDRVLTAHPPCAAVLDDAPPCTNRVDVLLHCSCRACSSACAQQACLTCGCLQRPGSRVSNCSTCF